MAGAQLGQKSGTAEGMKGGAGWNGSGLQRDEIFVGRPVPNQVVIFGGLTRTTLPSRSIATLFMARRCMSSAFLTAAVTARFITALFENVSLTPRRLREFLLATACSTFHEFSSDIGYCDQASVRGMLTPYRDQAGHQS